MTQTLDVGLDILSRTELRSIYMLLAENGTILKAQECDYKENMDAMNDLASPSPIAVAAVRLQHILIRNFFVIDYCT